MSRQSLKKGLIKACLKVNKCFIGLTDRTVWLATFTIKNDCDFNGKRLEKC